MSGMALMEPESEQLLDFVQRGALAYFLDQSNPTNGLVADSTWQNAPSSITAVGFALASYPLAVEHALIPRAMGVERTLTTLRFFKGSPQGPEPDSTGYHGFYYHFLDMQTGRRAGKCELSSIDTAFLIMGALVAAQYFTGDTPAEREICHLAYELYEQVEWSWLLNADLTLGHGWYPESGFIPYCWQGYEESLFLHVLALGSSVWPVPAKTYSVWASTFRWETHYGYDLVYAAPLFIHQAAHIWLDLRGIQDEPMRARGIDYFENTRRATYVQQCYAIENPKRFTGYGEYAWGITASEGPGEIECVVDGVERRFYNYLARGVPDPDDGTLSPWVAVASLPFAPEIVLPTLAHYDRTYPQLHQKYGFTCSFNPSFPGDSLSGSPGWFSKDFYGLNLGTNALMIENVRTGFVWQLTRQCPPVIRGLVRAGFRGGWLETIG